MQSSGQVRTLVRVGKSIGYIRGNFEPRNAYQEFRVFYPLTKTSSNMAAMHIQVLPEAESNVYWKELDAKIEEENARQQEVLRKRHIAFLRKRGINIDSSIEYSRSRALFERLHRASVCYSCSSKVDNEQHLGCTICGWIICPNCGACGCGYEGRK